MSDDATHYLTSDGTGKVIGTGYTPDGTLPDNAHPCTREHVANHHLCTVDEETHAITLAPPPNSLTITAQVSRLERQQTPELVRRALLGNHTALLDLQRIDTDIEALKTGLPQ